MTKLSPWRRRATTALLALSLSGCFSLLDATADFGPRPYGGVRLWFGDGGSGYQAVAWLTVIGPLLDIPLCAVFDTLALPLTLARAIHRREQGGPPPAADPRSRRRVGPSTARPARPPNQGASPDPTPPQAPPTPQARPSPAEAGEGGPPRLKLEAGASDGG